MSRRRKRKLAPGQKRRVVARYEYRDARGRVRYVLVRYEPKDFAFRTPGGRRCDFAKCRPMLYRLPELLAADPATPVYVVEGEKDVDRLRSLGFTATCNAGGGGPGKWRLAHARHFRGRKAIIIPDNDFTGDDHAKDVARCLRKQGVEVRILRLPDLPRKGDVSDWLDAGGTAEQLVQLSQEATVWLDEPLRPPPSFGYGAMHFSDWNCQRIIASRLPAAEKLLLLVLDVRRGRCSQSELAGYLSITPRRIRQMIAGLKSQGVLEITTSGRENRYRVLFEKLVQSAP